METEALGFILLIRPKFLAKHLLLGLLVCLGVSTKYEVFFLIPAFFK